MLIQTGHLRPGGLATSLLRASSSLSSFSVPCVCFCFGRTISSPFLGFIIPTVGECEEFRSGRLLCHLGTLTYLLFVVKCLLHLDDFAVTDMHCVKFMYVHVTLNMTPCLDLNVSTLIQRLHLLVCVCFLVETLSPQCLPWPLGHAPESGDLGADRAALSLSHCRLAVQFSLPTASDTSGSSAWCWGVVRSHNEPRRWPSG